MIRNFNNMHYLGCDPPIPLPASRLVKEFAINHRGMFDLGGEEHECELEGWIACELDGSAVDRLCPLKEQAVYRFMPFVCGVEMLGLLPIAQQALFAKCYSSERGRERLVEICKRANGEMR
jgi:hypothetical protein